MPSTVRTTTPHEPPGPRRSGRIRLQRLPHVLNYSESDSEPEYPYPVRLTTTLPTPELTISQHFDLDEVNYSNVNSPPEEPVVSEIRMCSSQNVGECGVESVVGEIESSKCEEAVNDETVGELEWALPGGNLVEAETVQLDPRRVSAFYTVPLSGVQSGSVVSEWSMPEIDREVDESCCFLC